MPGLAAPLVGFWGVFFQVVSEGPSAFRRVPGNDSGGGGSSVGARTGGGLPSELVWKVLVHACRLRLATRRGLEGHGDGDEGSTPDKARAEAAACQLRERDVSRALWACVRLLLAASPFAAEFGGGGGGTAGRQPSAVTATAKATFAAAAIEQDAAGKLARRSAASSSSTALPPPVTAAPECYTAPGAAARVLLERVLALARFRAPEAEAGGVVERLWEGVQRISGVLCADAAAAAAAASDTGEATQAPAVGMEDRGHERHAGSTGGRRAESRGANRISEREKRRERSARRLARRPTLSSAAASVGETHVETEINRESKHGLEISWLASTARTFLVSLFVGSATVALVWSSFMRSNNEARSIEFSLEHYPPVGQSRECGEVWREERPSPIRRNRVFHAKSGEGTLLFVSC